MKELNNCEAYYPMDPRFIFCFKIIQKNPNQTFLNLPVMCRAENIDVDRLNYAVSMITKRHESLRSTFNEIDGEYFQIVKKEMHVEIERYDSVDINSICKPFDIFNGPCFRIGVYQDIIIFDFHHFIMDGYSIGLFFIELNKFYSGKNFKSLELPRINELYAPQNIIEENNGYWINKLDLIKKDKKTEVDEDKIVGNCEILYYPVRLNFFRKMKTFAMNNKITPNIVALAAYILLLRQRKDLEILSICTNMSCRNMKNIKSMGLFTNPVIMLFKYNESVNLKDFLNYVSSENEEFLKHQVYEYLKVLDTLNLNRYESGVGIFVYQREMIAEIKIDDKICSPIPIPIKDTSSEIVTSFFASKQVPCIQLEYKSAMHSREEMEVFLDDYIKILDMIISESVKNTGEILDEINKPHELYYGHLARNAKDFYCLEELFAS